MPVRSFNARCFSAFCLPHRASSGELESHVPGTCPGAPPVPDGIVGRYTDKNQSVPRQAWSYIPFLSVLTRELPTALRRDLGELSQVGLECPCTC